MRKNEILGVKPFNGFHYKSCYYHQLISGLACFGIAKENILLNSFGEIQAGFEYNGEEYFSEKQLEKALGYKNIKCSLDKKALIKYIDKGEPLIVGVDCFYLESRTDSYQLQHIPHFILAYGYDLDRNEAKVIDHNYFNSYEFMEKVISLDNLLYASYMFKRGVLNRKYPCRRLKGRKEVKTFHIWDYIGEKRIIENRNYAIENLKSLQELVLAEQDELKEKAEKICSYLEKLKGLYFSISKIYVFSEEGKQRESMERLVSGYSNLVSLFWKMRAQNDYTYAKKRKDAIFRKIEEMKGYEKIVCEGLLEVIK